MLPGGCVHQFRDRLGQYGRRGLRGPGVDDRRSRRARRRSRRSRRRHWRRRPRSPRPHRRPPCGSIPCRPRRGRRVRRRSTSPRPSSRARAGRRRWPRLSNLSAVMTPRSRRARRSSSSVARASSKRSITACESDPRLNNPQPASSAAAGPMPSPRSRSVVGQKHTPVAVRSRSARSSSVRWVAWTAVVRGPSTPASRSSAVGVAPCTARHWSISAVCSDECTCSGAPWASAHSTTAGMCSSGTPRTECSAAPTITAAVGRPPGGAAPPPARPRHRRCRRRSAAAGRRPTARRRRRS